MLCSWYSLEQMLMHECHFLKSSLDFVDFMNIAKIEIVLNWEWIPKFQSTNCQFVRGILFDDLDVCLFWKTLKLEIYKWVQEWHSWLALPKGRVEEEYHSIHCKGVQKQGHSKFERVKSKSCIQFFGYCWKILLHNTQGRSKNWVKNQAII